MLYRAKRKDNKEWVQGYYVCIESIPDKTHYIYTGKMSNLEAERYEILPKTLCRSMDYKDFFGAQIFDKDILRFTTHGDNIFCYLLQWVDEGQEFKAIPINNGDNIIMLFSHYLNYSRSLSWDDFIPMLQNVYGDSKEIKVIGNLIDSPELIPILI